MTTSSETTDRVASVELAAEIVAAYVANNSVAVGELPGLIANIHTALQRLGAPAEEPASKPQPAVPIKKSVTADFIVCLEDGKKFKSLKRHLRTRYDMTPEDYRQKWGLPADYPMVAPNYAAARSELAKTMGLGQQRRKTPEPAPVAKSSGRKAKAAAEPVVEVKAPAPAKRKAAPRKKAAAKA
ncbi:Ros/MucR family transcriptional regulator [Chelatococcus asaccharovorans]|uniref:MucR family transcriptional regulator n=1 Tax=Chelatococcus asaccharovorans TaxID=28210 RepID=A0A2V3TV11_9HYPH|nr:MucR family transcriptional regulator [Chelatococcus asaccharovorans]MBS7704121.1 MucR family transcriptional regulator [Chelatococcus asaccharovorans]PXW53252.1 MucR family transcriptional regulator [Chelatococcus asaccharovorans]CAH1666041.1 MucR family transcriptional regulator [Chelatococcus asaccharovorans]CAH1681659.1 MucR family transcriptional regulator [Chelatococcus asaccharovorans]